MPITQRFDEWFPGRRLTRRDVDNFNRLADQVDRLSNITGGGATDVEDNASGIQINTPPFLLGVQDTRYCTTTTAPMSASAGTTVSVLDYALFPAAGNYYVQIDSEIMLVTAGQGTNTWTVTRAQLGTNQMPHDAGVQICQVFPPIMTTLNGSMDNVTASLIPAGLQNFPTDGKFFVLVDSEIMLVQQGAGSLSWTVRRGFHTLASSHVNGSSVYHILADQVSEIQQIVFDDQAFVQPGNDDTFIAVHHEVTQLIRIVSGPNIHNYYDAFLQKMDIVNQKLVDSIPIWYLDANSI